MSKLIVDLGGVQQAQSHEQPVYWCVPRSCPCPQCPNWNSQAVQVKPTGSLKSWEVRAS